MGGGEGRRRRGCGGEGGETGWGGGGGGGGGVLGGGGGEFGPNERGGSLGVNLDNEGGRLPGREFGWGWVNLDSERAVDGG